VPGKSTPRLPRCASVVLLSACLALAAPCRADLIPQPVNKGSSLASQGGNIHDRELAGWLRKALVRDEKANVREATFLFNSCYGGGMLDDIDAAMGKTVRWTGGAASRHNQYAIGQNSPAENQTLKRPAVFVDDRPMSYWTRALVPTMEARDATVFGALQTAATMDQVAAAAARDPAIDAGLATPLEAKFGDVRVRPEEVQSVARNGGDAMKMNCDGCGKRRVVIWAGNTDRMRAFHDVEGMIDVLRTHWPGDPGDVVIKVFYADGRQKVTGPLQPLASENRLPAEWGAAPARAAALQRYL
jgi:hypothetical protein